MPNQDRAVRVGRIARRWGRAQQTWKMRVEQSTGRVRYRRSRSRVKLMTNGGRGWIAVNDGPAFAAGLARYLDQLAHCSTGSRLSSVSPPTGGATAAGGRRGDTPPERSPEVWGAASAPRAIGVIDVDARLIEEVRFFQSTVRHGS
ncbi:hypothetical protein [Pseudonocardia sp. NPDC049635]|uniref:hypothetical protein n=1 Tax=Pseudonocardia sp. NPDC049635 TaxID=3155506 RepID=UPI0033D96A6D